MKATHDILIETKRALPALAASGEKKNAALKAIASKLIAEKDAILEANALDVEAARERLGDVMIDRLTLTEARIEGMAQGVLDVAALPDPEGRVLRRIERPNGIVIEKTSVPLGVVSIIYESRPKVCRDFGVGSFYCDDQVTLKEYLKFYWTEYKKMVHGDIQKCKTFIKEKFLK